MLVFMRSVFLSIGGVGPNWMQHHLPWLAVLAMLFGVSRDEPSTDPGPGLDG